MLRSITLLLIATHLINGLPDGAPLNSCSTLTPIHGDLKTQIDNAPYNIISQPSEVQAGAAIKLMITGNKPENVIRGFIIKAIANGSTVGKFDIPDSDPFAQSLNCDGVKASAATHKHIDDNPQNVIVLNWIAPDDFKEPVVFHATVAESYERFWIGKLMATVNII